MFDLYKLISLDNDYNLFNLKKKEKFLIDFILYQMKNV